MKIPEKKISLLSIRMTMKKKFANRIWLIHWVAFLFIWLKKKQCRMSCDVVIRCALASKQRRLIDEMKLFSKMKDKYWTCLYEEMNKINILSLSISNRDLLALNVIDIWSCSLFLSFSTCEIHSNVFIARRYFCFHLSSFAIRSSLINASATTSFSIDTNHIDTRKDYFSSFRSTRLTNCLFFFSHLFVVLVLRFQMNRRKQKMIVTCWLFLMWSKMDLPMENFCKFFEDF